MIHRIAIGRAVLLDLREVDPVASRRLASLLQRPRQTSDSRVKYGDVLRHHLRRVALWVDGEEERLNALGARAEFIHDKRYLVEGGRADVGAVREAEERQYPPASEILVRDPLAGMIGQREIARDRARKRVGLGKRVSVRCKLGGRHQ